MIGLSVGGGRQCNEGEVECCLMSSSIDALCVTLTSVLLLALPSSVTYKLVVNIC